MPVAWPGLTRDERVRPWAPRASSSPKQPGTPSPGRDPGASPEGLHAPSASPAERHAIRAYRCHQLARGPAGSARVMIAAQAPRRLGAAIFIEAALSIVGVGVPPPSGELGQDAGRGTFCGAAAAAADAVSWPSTRVGRGCAISLTGSGSTSPRTRGPPLATPRPVRPLDISATPAEHRGSGGATGGDENEVKVGAMRARPRNSYPQA